MISKRSWIHYHVDEDENPILDEEGDLIPEHICICYAHGYNDCCCGAWDVESPEPIHSGQLELSLENTVSTE